MNDQRIDMVEKKVSLHLADGSTMEGFVYLSHYKCHDSRPESVGDLLNREKFIPLKGTGRVVLINVERITAARVDRQGGEDNDMEDLGIRYPVTIRTVEGKEIRGDFIVDLPEEACRVKDYLNQEKLFLRLSIPEGVVYMSRHYILSVAD